MDADLLLHEGRENARANLSGQAKYSRRWHGFEGNAGRKARGQPS